MQKTTLSDIAKELNLSVASVGRALSDRGGNTRISEKTRVRVLEVAKRLNYQTNSAARALCTKLFNNIGYFTFKRQPTDYSFAEIIIEGLSDAASEFGQNIVLVHIPSSKDQIHEIPRALKVQCLDAIIISDTTKFLPGFQSAVEASGIPVVYLNEKHPTNSVYVNDVLTGKMMAQHLIDKGYKKISFLSPYNPRIHYSHYDRLTGYSEAMLAAGLKPDVQLFEGYKSWHHAAYSWLSSHERPEAIACNGDIMALALQRILYHLKLRVPDDIAIMGCDGQDHALRSAVPLTTLEIPFRSMAAEAMRMAIKLARDPERKSTRSVIFNPRLIATESTNISPLPHPFIPV